MCVDSEKLLERLIDFNLKISVSEIDLRKDASTVECSENILGERKRVLVELQSII